MLHNTEATFAKLNISSSQNNYNTVSHKGLQSYYSMPAANDPPLDPSNNGPASEPLPSPTWRLSKEPVFGSAEINPLTARTPRDLIDRSDNEDGDQTSNNSDPTIIPNAVEKSSNIYDDPSLVTSVPFKLSPPSSLDPQSFTTAQELRQILNSYGVLYPTNATTSQLQEVLERLVQDPSKVERRKLDQLPPGWSKHLVPKSGRVYYQNHIEKSTTWADPRTPNLDLSLDTRGDTALPPRNLSNPANYVDPYRGDLSNERSRNDPLVSASQQLVTTGWQHPQRVSKPKKQGIFSKLFGVSGLHTSAYTIC
jgi:hypothetical protein